MRSGPSSLGSSTCVGPSSGNIRESGDGQLETHEDIPQQDVPCVALQRIEIGGFREQRPIPNALVLLKAPLTVQGVPIPVAFGKGYSVLLFIERVPRR